MEELKHQPFRLWRLDDDTPFSEYSGFASSGTRAGTESRGVALTADAVYSQTFRSTAEGTFGVSGFLTQGTEGQEFSISLTALPATGGQLVLAHTDNGAKLTVSDTKIEFSLFYSDTTSVTVTYKVQCNQKA